MPTLHKLTDSQCRAAKPREKAYKLFDGGGLALVVLPSGAKSWRLFYRADGKPQTRSLGLYPAVGAAEARRLAAGAREAIARGDTPSGNPRARQAPDLTLREVCERYWQGRLDVTSGYRDNALRGLELHVWPALGGKPAGAVTRAEVLAVLSALDARGRHVYVRKVRVWLSLALDWWAELGEGRINVARSIDPKRAFARAAVEHHAALTLAEVPPLMARLALEAHLQSALALKLLALTWTRTGELRAMRWDEIERDAAGRPVQWRLSRARMKMRREHIVPLSRQAAQILAELQARAAASPYVFPNDRRPADRPMSENSMLYLLGRMGYGGRMTGHGWRSIGSTWANEAGFGADAIERQLAHAPADKVRAAYNAAQYMPERVRMLQAWADWLMPDLPPAAEPRR